MPRVVIAGCGYVGAVAAELFHAAGWEVEGWTGSRESAAALAARPFPIRAVDLTIGEAVAQAARPCDVIIQSASSRGGGAEEYRKIYLGAAQHLRAAWPGALLVFTSSTSVYAQKNGEWVTEESAAEPAHETGRILRETEEFVCAHGGLVARLAGIYGPGRSALLRKFLDGTATIDARTERFVNQVHRDDVASALVFLARAHLGRPAREAAQVFNVSDNHPLTQRECYEWLARRLGRPFPPERPAPAQRRRGNSNKRVSSARLHALGWTPRYPTFAQGMTESVLLHPL